MTSRAADTLSYDAENRLTQVTSGGTTTTYAYDGDGKRVKKTVGGTTTYYVGNWYEVTGATATKYYYFGAQRVAMKQGNDVTYLHGDHLGSTSVTSGASSSAQTYYPYGAVRTTQGTISTDYTFTGQKVDASAGLMYYGARYYDAGIGRFVQADTIVPNPFNPQDLNRYAYVRNNPVRYTDPTGHRVCEDVDCRITEPDLPKLPAETRGEQWPSGTPTPAGVPTVKQTPTVPGGVPTPPVPLGTPTPHPLGRQCLDAGAVPLSPEGCESRKHPVKEAPGDEPPYLKLPLVWVPSPGQKINPMGKALLVGFGWAMEAGLLEITQLTVEATAVAAGTGQFEVAVPLGVLSIGELVLSYAWGGTMVNITLMPTE